MKWLEEIARLVFPIFLPFVKRPWLAACVALFFLALSFWFQGSGRAMIVGVSLLWVCYFFWEWHCFLGRYNIRVDLLFFGPPLIFCTLAGVIFAVCKKGKR